MSVSDPEDIIRLMQMGANYQKKMAQLKPNLKIIKMLENNDLLNPEKLHNLIDLSKKDPKAVAKLVKDSGIDPLDIDSAQPDDYRPQNYTVSDKEYNLDQVLDSIKDTASFTRTIDVLTKDWDTGSRNIISDNPDIISVINEHMENGVFDKVNTILQQEKTLGKLSGVSDVEAYHMVAQEMHRQGLLVSNSPAAATPSKAEVSSESKVTSQAAVERSQKRKAVAPVKRTASKPQPASQDFLGLSDDDFMKKYGSR